MEYDALTKCRRALKSVTSDRLISRYLRSDHPKVLAECEDALMADNDVIPRAVVLAMLKAWPDQFAECIAELKWSGDHYFLNKWGMYVGIEVDGYIHT